VLRSSSEIVNSVLDGSPSSGVDRPYVNVVSLPLCDSNLDSSLSFVKMSASLSTISIVATLSPKAAPPVGLDNSTSKLSKSSKISSSLMAIFIFLADVSPASQVRVPLLDV
jgi:hypothetical protein